MSRLTSPTPPDPQAGYTGHFDHHVWLKDGVVELDTALELVAPSVSGDRPTIDGAAALLDLVTPEAVVLKQILTALNDAHITNASGFTA